MGTIVKFLQSEMEKPGLFSLFHIISLLIIIGITILIAIKYKNCSLKTYKRIIFIIWLVCIVFEILKQITRNFIYGPPLTFHYDFYHLPFHLCSTMFYVVPILLFTSKDKHPLLHEAITGYICFFVFFAGMVVCVYNQFVMTNIIFINIQTMIHHGSQVVLGVFMITWNRKNINLKMYFESLIVLGIFIPLAIIINVLIYPISDGIDMFYINPYQISYLPVFDKIQEKAGYVVYLILYMISLSVSGLIMYLLEKGCIKLSYKKKTKNAN